MDHTGCTEIKSCDDLNPAILLMRMTRKRLEVFLFLGYTLR
jgi:hypothetical protein